MFTRNSAISLVRIGTELFHPCRKVGLGFRVQSLRLLGFLGWLDPTAWTLTWRGFGMVVKLSAPEARLRERK